jgi:hypothetical protein
MLKVPDKQTTSACLGCRQDRDPLLDSTGWTRDARAETNNLDRDGMTNSLLNPRLDTAHWEPKFPFDLVVAYEDTHTRNRAQHLYDHLAQQLLDDYDFQCSWWKFDHLSNAALRRQAADAATEANMIILCMRAREHLMPVHRHWLEDWLPRRDNRKAALVALIGGGEDSSGSTEPMLAYLRQAARLAHMDFFDHAFDLSLPAREVPLPQGAETPRLAPSVAEELLYHQMPNPRWGINE